VHVHLVDGDAPGATLGAQPRAGEIATGGLPRTKAPSSSRQDRQARCSGAKLRGRSARAHHRQPDVRALPRAFGKHGAPVVMVHGSNHTGMTYETTPDGREGWATYFLRKGAPSTWSIIGTRALGFDPTPFNRRATIGRESRLAPHPAPRHARARLAQLPLGPSYPVPFPGLQFPVEAMEQYTMQLVPNAETSLAGIGANTVNGSPCCSTASALRPSSSIRNRRVRPDLVRQRPKLVRALVTVEAAATASRQGRGGVFHQGAGALAVGRQQRRRQADRQRRRAAQRLPRCGQRDQAAGGGPLAVLPDIGSRATAT